MVVRLFMGEINEFYQHINPQFVLSSYIMGGKDQKVDMTLFSGTEISMDEEWSKFLTIQRQAEGEARPLTFLTFLNRDHDENGIDLPGLPIIGRKCKTLRGNHDNYGFENGNLTLDRQNLKKKSKKRNHEGWPERMAKDKTKKYVIREKKQFNTD